MAQNPEGNTRRYRTVLISRFSALGDVAMTIPVIYSACRCYPDVRFVMVTRPQMTAMFVNAPANLTLAGADVNKDYAGIGGIRRLCAELVEKYSPDVYVDLHNVLRTRLMSAFLRLAGIPTARLFKARAHRRALTRSRNKVMLPLISQRARYSEAFFKAGLPITDCFDGLYHGHGTADPGLFAAITAPKPPGERWIGIAPFAAHNGKIYPPELMEKVIAMLQERADSGLPLRIFLFGGGADEVRRLTAWADRFPAARSLAGLKAGFSAELALINHLDVMLSMDSANMHLAAIAGAPTVSVWGATHPYCGFEGWRQTDDGTIQLPLSCRPCSVFGDKPCRNGDLLCLRGIKPDVIFNKLMLYV